jgi:histidine phosphotransferase ChpT
MRPRATGQIQVDLKVLQLLCSKLCHDLVGPVGAVNNGVELVREMGAGMDKEAMDLVATSARQVAERLQFFRVAFGLASGAIKTSREARNLLTHGVIGGKKELVWPEADSAEVLPLDDNGLKLLLNMIFLASDSLPRGGRVDVYVEPSGEVVRLTITAGGTGVTIHDEALRALAGDMAVGDLTPRVVHHYYTGLLAQQQGSGIDVDYPRTDLMAIRAVAHRSERGG